MQEKLLLTIDETFPGRRLLHSSDRASNRTYCRMVREGERLHWANSQGTITRRSRTCRVRGIAWFLG
jgi:hypothetical protein